MPRVVPSDVVSFIDRTLGWLAVPGGSPGLNRAHAGPAAALIYLVEQIPDELLTLTSSDYAEFVLSVATINHHIVVWQTEPPNSNSHINFIVRNLNPVTLIRQVLLKCPDESPSPATAELAFVSDQELRLALRNDIGGVGRALSNGEWKAATILAGSTIEALLLWDLQNRCADSVPGAIAALKLNPPPPSNPEDWSLYHYIVVSAHLGRIEQKTTTEANLAKDFRNLIHPGRAQRLGQKYDRGTALVSVAALDHVVTELSRWP
jgi:hypothetical protein